jgi:hypothetical protein
MVIKLSAKSVVVVLVAAALVAVIVLKIKPFPKNHAPDPGAVAACQKQVETTYTSLRDTSGLVAPGTTSTIQKQEDDAKSSCSTSH